MRTRYYSPQLDRIVYLDERPTPEFWDARWNAEGWTGISRQDEMITEVTALHLPAGARVLEGGCGRGNKVKALYDSGFAATGVDFAAESVRQARRVYPHLDIREGDVRHLPFPSGHFDGYWSLGVIEHFWTGYDAILAEASRVLKPGGMLFLTAPWLSPCRRFAVRRGVLPTRDFDAEPGDFYQFALGRQEVRAALKRHGFDPLHWRGLAPEVCLLEDFLAIRKPAHWLFGSRGSPAKRILRRMIVALTRDVCGHAFLTISRRRLLRGVESH